jgi:hypothetical protein
MSQREYFEYRPDDTDYGGASDVVEREIQHIQDWRGRDPQLGLALSGGGIRSASFCLGALTALAHGRSLEKFDYLSSVSGGGYIAASMTYLLQQPAHAAGDAGATAPAKFDVSRERFPYLSYPMVNAPLPSEDESFQEKGRLLRRLRQNAKYLAPGNGITTLSLAGLFVRNLAASVCVHVAVLLLLFQFFVYTGLLSLHTPSNGLLMLAAAALLSYVLVSAFYIILTGFFDPIEALWSEGPYRLRRMQDVFTSGVLVVALVTLIVGALPWVYSFINDLNWPQWLALFDLKQSKDRSLVAAVISTAIGVIGNVWGFVQARSAKNPRIPIDLLVNVACALLAFGLLLAVFVLTKTLNERLEGNSLMIALVALVPLILMGWLPDANYVSLHRFYRDRLTELFLPDLTALEKNEDVGVSNAGDAAMLGEMCGMKSDRVERFPGPYHIINANVVLVASQHPRYRGRGGDNYILSPLFCGSRATGWRQTDSSPENGFTLATAMAISGAAINPNAGPGGAGITRQPLLSVLMGLLNLRLGYWCSNPNPNPKPSAGFSSTVARLFARKSTPNMISPGLFESFGRSNLNEHEPYVLLTDGGHFENLGLYELVRRRLKLIVVCDATADEDFKFVDLANAIEKVRADFGAIIHVHSGDLDPLVPRRPSGASPDDPTPPLAQRGYLMAPITYARRDAASYGDGADRGVLIYLKATFFKELYADLHGYRRAHEDFPDQSTGNQFFDEKQFESYRELGFQTTWLMLQNLRTNDDQSPTTLKRQAAALLWAAD